MKTKKKYLLIHQHFEKKVFKYLFPQISDIQSSFRVEISSFFVFVYLFSAPCFALTYRLLCTNSFHHFFLKLPLNALKALY